MSRLSASATSLEGVMRIQRMVQEDQRGSFSRVFCGAELASAGWHGGVSQANHTLTRTTGTVRGLHFQSPPHAEYKLITCLSGEVFDVAVDIRRGSRTFLRWHAERLSSENGRSLLIPPGFAHGFQALTDEVQLLYFHSCAYEPAAEGGLHPADPVLGIAWPMPVIGLSDRDASHPAIDPSFPGISP